MDFAKGTITVADTGHHKPKTASSYRTLPVPARVLDVLAEAALRQKVKPGAERFSSTGWATYGSMVLGPTG